MPETRERRRSALSARTVSLFLIASLCVGLAAAFLSAPLPSAPPPASAPVLLGVPLWVVALFGIAFLALFIGYGLYRRLTGGYIPLPRIAVLILLTPFLVGTLFVYILRLGSGTNWLHTANSAGPGSQNTTPLNGGNLTNSSSPYDFGSVPLLGHGVSLILVVVGLLGAAVVVALVATPYLLAMRSELPLPDSDGPSRARIKRRLEEAIAALELAGPDDARSRVISVYARLLAQLTDRMAMIEVRTAREIEIVLTQGLKVRSSTAHTLTLLFEEARYSHHAIGSDLAERAKEALQQAVRDLESAPGVV